MLFCSVDKSKPSVRLNWDPPTNAAYAGYVTKYHICFWDKEKGCYREKSVDGSTTTAVFTRETGLRPLTLSTFEVRACSGDDVSTECRTVSAFLGMQAGIDYLTNTRNFTVIYSYKQIALSRSLRWSRVIYSIYISFCDGVNYYFDFGVAVKLCHIYLVSLHCRPGTRSNSKPKS